MKANEKRQEYAEKAIRNIAEHPCYNAGAHLYARMHIPIAPACNIQCNYCNRKFDCTNESRPGVTSEVLTPGQALERFKDVKSRIETLRVVGIAGPGDALADFEKTKKSIQLIREYDPNITICLSTNGLLLPKYAQELYKLNVHHVTVTINAVDPEIGKKIYGRVHYEGKVYENGTGAKILMENQIKGLRQMANYGAVCKVNIVMIKGINEHHIKDVVQKAKDNGAYITNITPLIPVKNTPFENLSAPGHDEIHAARKESGDIILQMYHCRQCRADAIGMLGQDVSLEYRSSPCKAEPLGESKEKESAAK